MPEIETEVRRQTISLSSLQLKEFPIAELLKGQRIFDLAIEMEEIGLKGDFQVFAAAGSIKALCENYWPGSTKGGTFESSMFQVACDSAAFMVGQASAEFANTARFNQAKPSSAQVWTNTSDEHAPQYPEMSGLCMVREGGRIGMIWGYEKDITELGLTAELPEARVLN